MKPLLAAFLVLPLFAATKVPTDWAPVQTNAIARWKAANRAPDGVVWDRAAHAVRFLAEATGIGTGEPVEFLAIGPLSDRAYESLLVTVASPGAARAGSAAQSTANTSAAAYHGRTLGFWVRITLLMHFLLSRRGTPPLVLFHNKSFYPQNASVS